MRKHLPPVAVIYAIQKKDKCFQCRRWPAIRGAKHFFAVSSRPQRDVSALCVRVCDVAHTLACLNAQGNVFYTLSHVYMRRKMCVLHTFAFANALGNVCFTHFRICKCTRKCVFYTLLRVQMYKEMCVLHTFACANTQGNVCFAHFRMCKYTRKCVFYTLSHVQMHTEMCVLHTFACANALGNVCLLTSTSVVHLLPRLHQVVCKSFCS